MSIMKIFYAILWMLILTVFSVACNSTESILTSTPKPSLSELETIQPIAQTETPTALAKPSITPTLQTTPLPTPTKMPISTTVIETATLQSILSPFQKLVELPASGTGLATSIDGSLLSTSNINTGVLYVLNMDEKEIKWELEEDSRVMTGYTALSFSPNGDFLAGGGVQQDVFVWNMNSGKLVYSLPVTYDVVDALSFSTDGNFLAISSFQTPTPDVEITLWNLQTGQLTKAYSLKNFLEEFNIDIGIDANSMSPAWSIRDIEFLPEQNNLIAITIDHHENQEGVSNKALYYWDFINEELVEVLSGDSGRILSTSSDGKLLVTEIDDRLQVIDIPTNTNILELDLERNDATNKLAISNAGFIARLERGDGVKLWNIEGDFVGSLDLEMDKTISNILFTPEGNLIVASYIGNDDAPVEVWTVK